MTHRPLGALVGAVLAIGTALGAVAIAAPAAAVPAGTDIKDPSCVAGDTRALCAEPEQLLDVRIGDVHPTQPSLGYDEVYYKLGRYSTALSKDAVNKKFDDWCEANGQGAAAATTAASTLRDSSSFGCTIPLGSETADSIAPMKTVVIGPKGALYLTDGHHTLTSFAEDAQGGMDTHVRLRVLGNLSGLDDAAFWDAMKANKWTWLRDVDGNAITPAQLPKTVGLASFEDDRYRSIMYFARDIGYSADGAVPFQEFYWGTWLRAQAGIDVAGWKQDDWDASLALVKQITQAQVALAPGDVVDNESGYTAADLSAFTAWNDGKAETKGEWAKLAQPYSSAKPGKLAYMTAYRATLAPSATAPAAPAAPTATVNGSDVTVSWAAPADGGSPITGYTVRLSDGTSRTLDAGALSTTFAGLPAGQYTATVAATNAIGSSPASPASAPVTVGAGGPGTDPGTPDPTTVHGTVIVTGDLVAGGRVTVAGAGFAANVSGVRVELHSDPVLLGTVSTDAAGAFTLSASIPATVPAGTHRVVVIVNGVQVGAATVAVAAADPAPAATGDGGSEGELASTGSRMDGSPLLAAGAFAAVIAGAVIVALRRRANAG
ncbi:ParB-like protein [uncultured Leifsonia sp.]|uniref:ParB-like protein n=1 Tax=uncultured Leifsonia sp. TaxID=340359 RepID=UPI0028D7E860|nr:ParB-like protein [uncultured Leifsonia sp.]